jgi:hypothetical protein
MNTTTEETLRQILTALAFDHKGTFALAGWPATQWSTPAAAQPLPATVTTVQNPTVQALQNALYATCYTRPFNGVVDQSPLQITSNIDNQWIAVMSQANASKERWEEGWQIGQFLPSGEIYANKGAIQRAFWPGEFVRSGDYGQPPQQGTPISVFLPRESRTAQPGFYFAFGETLALAQDEFPTVRFYWNINRDGAAPLVKKISTSLNKYHVPFRFKVVSHPALLDRCDTAVLYVGRRYYRVAAELALETRDQLGQGIEPAVPLFTLKLAAGLAFAEDPGGQESFGMSRCRLLAEGAWLAFSEGQTNIEGRLNRVQQHFAAAGTSLERPYLNFAAIQSYEFPQ